MKTWCKLLLCVTLSFMCIFTSIGYAGFTSNLVVNSEAELVPPTAIFITSITNVRTSAATVNTRPVNIDAPSTKFLSEITFDGKSSFVTFDVTIVNRTPIKQYFDKIDSLPGLDGSADSFSYSGINCRVTPGQGTEIEAGGQVTFTVTLTYTGTGKNQTRRMLHEFDFALDVDNLTQAVSVGVNDKFAAILNNQLEEDVTYTYNGSEITVDNANTFETLISHMESDTSGAYIGNLQGADGDDKALLTALFDDALTFKVGDEEVPITVMVKEKNVYGSSEKEWVLYITADTLSQTWTYVPVYAVVYSKNAAGEWAQVGDIFAGEARTNNYSGWYGNGSFNTESWRSTAVYYGVSVRSGINAIMSAYNTQ